MSGLHDLELDLVEADGDTIDRLVAEIASSQLTDGVRREVAPSPEGSKGIGVAGLVVVAVAPAATTALLAMLQDWLARQRGEKIRVRVGDVEVEIVGERDPDEAIAVAGRLAALFPSG